MQSGVKNDELVYLHFEVLFRNLQRYESINSGSAILDIGMTFVIKG